MRHNLASEYRYPGHLPPRRLSSDFHFMGPGTEYPRPHMPDRSELHHPRPFLPGGPAYLPPYPGYVPGRTPSPLQGRGATPNYDFCRPPQNLPVRGATPPERRAYNHTQGYLNGYPNPLRVSSDTPYYPPNTPDIFAPPTQRVSYTPPPAIGPRYSESSLNARPATAAPFKRPSLAQHPHLQHVTHNQRSYTPPAKATHPSAAAKIASETINLQEPKEVPIKRAATARPMKPSGAQDRTEMQNLPPIQLSFYPVFEAIDRDLYIETFAMGNLVLSLGRSLQKTWKIHVDIYEPLLGILSEWIRVAGIIAGAIYEFEIVAKRAADFGSALRQSALGGEHDPKLDELWTVHFETVQCSITVWGEVERELKIFKKNIMGFVGADKDGWLVMGREKRRKILMSSEEFSLPLDGLISSVASMVSHLMSEQLGRWGAQVRAERHKEKATCGSVTESIALWKKFYDVAPSLGAPLVANSVEDSPYMNHRSNLIQRNRRVTARVIAENALIQLKYLLSKCLETSVIAPSDAESINGWLETVRPVTRECAKSSTKAKNLQEVFNTTYETRFKLRVKGRI